MNGYHVHFPVRRGDLMTLANLLTGLRVVLMAPLLWCLVTGEAWLALVLFLIAGLTDVLDGYVARRLNQASRFGAFFDLLADRIMTLVVSLGLIISRPHDLVLLASCIVLIGRNSVIAGLSEALPGQPGIALSGLEKVKIAFNFIGFAFVMAPPLFDVPLPRGEHFFVNYSSREMGVDCLAVSAVLCLATVADYAARAYKSRVSE